MLMLQGGRTGAGGRPGSGVSSARRGRFPAARPQKYDRLKFLQANYRFLVSDAVEVEQFAADADKMLDWEDVIEVGR